MTRLIDADELLKYKTDHEMISTHLIYNAPTVDAMPVRHGKWKKTSYRWVIYECSECGEKTDVTIMGSPRYVYCPMCGARMDEE